MPPKQILIGYAFSNMDNSQQMQKSFFFSLEMILVTNIATFQGSFRKECEKGLYRAYTFSSGMQFQSVILGLIRNCLHDLLPWKYY